MRRFPSSLLQFTSRDRLPSYMALGMLIGAIWYFSIEFEPSFYGLLLAASLAGAATWWISSLQRASVLFVVALVAFSATLGALAGHVATQRMAHAQIEQPTGPVLVEGWVTRVQSAKRGVRVVVRVHAVNGLPRDKTPESVRLTHIARFETEPGRFVRCWAVLRPPPAPVIAGDYAFDRQAWYSRLGAVGYVQGRCRGGALGAPQGRFAAADLHVGKSRRRLAQHVRAAAGERAGGFAAALASGDRSFLAEADQDALRGAGLAHLLAISGLHIGIVGGLVFLLVWRTLALIEPIAVRGSVKKPAAVAALLVCAAYLIISGASISTQRAFVMAVIFFGAVLIDRAALTQRSLAIAMMVVVLIAPWSVLTPGFQMSFAATLVLIATFDAWKLRRAGAQSGNRAGFWLKSLVVTSVVTTLATMPFAVYHFERAAGLGVIANTLAMPIISLVSAPLAALALVLAPVGLDGLALRALGLSLEWVLSIAHMVDSWTLFEGQRIPKMPAESLAQYAGAMIAICFFAAGWARRCIAIGLILTASLTWVASARDRVHWAPSGDIFLEHARGKIERIGFHDGDGLSPLRFSEQSRARACATSDVCMVQFNQAEIALLGATTNPTCDAATGAAIVLTITDRTDCLLGNEQILLTWSDIVRENGVTLERTGGTFEKKRKPDCDGRPWRQCP